MALPLLRFVAYKDFYTISVENLTQLSVPQIQQLETYAADRRSRLDFESATMTIWKRIDFDHFNKTLELSGILADTIESEVVRPDSVAIEPIKDPVVGFGKHRGKRYRDIPDSYLLWLKGNYSGPERGVIEAELARRSL